MKKIRSGVAAVSAALAVAGFVSGPAQAQSETKEDSSEGAVATWGGSQESSVFIV